MRAAVLSAPLKLKITDYSRPVPGPGEVLIKVTLAGVCGTDYSLYTGRFDLPLPVIPGHEGIGVIEELGPGVCSISVGQRVAIQPNFPCHTCSVCLAGYENVCPSKIRLGLDTDGVFAQFVRVPAEYVWPIPEDMDDRVAALAEPVAVAAHALGLVPPREGDRVLIIGAGVIGLFALQLLEIEDVITTASDLAAPRLTLAEQLGADQTHLADGGKKLKPSSFDLIYDTSGAPSALAQAVDLAAPGGRIALLGLPGEQYPVSTAQIVRKELKVTGSMIYTDEFPQVLDLLKSGVIQTGPFTDDVITLDNVEKTLNTFTDPDRVKTLISME